MNGKFKNIKMCLKNVGCETADWIYFCQDSDQWQVAGCCELEPQAA